MSTRIKDQLNVLTEAAAQAMRNAAYWEKEARALRARVAELEEKAERYRLTTLRQDAAIARKDKT